jgi:hypothetical protein
MPLDKIMSEHYQKDLPATAQPVNWFDVFGPDSNITIKELYQTQDPAHFTEIGAGTLNIPAIIEAARNIGCNNNSSISRYCVE